MPRGRPARRPRLGARTATRRAHSSTPGPLAKFSRSIHKSIRPHLGGSEQLLAAVPAQNAGSNAAAMTSALRGPLATAKAHQVADRRHADALAAADAAGLRVDRRMLIAVTTERLLVFRAGGAFTVKPRELIGQAPIAAVEAIDVEPDGRLTKAVTLRVRGAAIGVETARGQRPEELRHALAHAQADLRVKMPTAQPGQR